MQSVTSEAAQETGKENRPGFRFYFHVSAQESPVASAVGSSSHHFSDTLVCCSHGDAWESLLLPLSTLWVSLDLLPN